MKKVTFILAFAIACSTGYSQWQPSNGPEGESLKKIIYANGRLIAIPSGAGSLHEYYYSDTYGDAWQKDTFTLSSNPHDIIASGDYFVTRTNDGIFFSNNKGETWEQRHTGLPADVSVGALSESGNMIFIADGFSFTEFDGNLPAKCVGVYHIVQKNDTVFTAVVADPLEKPLIYYTTDALSGWEQYDHTGISDVLSDFRNNMKVFLASHSLFLSAPTDEAGFYRYDFTTLPEVNDTIDDYEYPDLEDNPSPVNINRQKKLNAIIYPNPASDNITIKSEQPVNNITVFNQQGISLIRQKGGAIQSVDVSALSPGIYFISIEQYKHINTYKIIIY